MNLLSLPQTLMDHLSGLLAANPMFGAWYTTIVRFVFPVLALLISFLCVNAIVL